MGLIMGVCIRGMQEASGAEGSTKNPLSNNLKKKNELTWIDHKKKPETEGAKRRKYNAMNMKFCPLPHMLNDPKYHDVPLLKLKGPGFPGLDTSKFTITLSTDLGKVILKNKCSWLYLLQTWPDAGKIWDPELVCKTVWTDEVFTAHAESLTLEDIERSRFFDNQGGVGQKVPTLPQTVLDAEDKAEVVEYLKLLRSNFLASVSPLWRKVKMIVQHRKNRLALLGPAEIDRRIQRQNYILDITVAENARRDQVPRTCIECKAVVTRSGTDLQKDLAKHRTTIHHHRAANWKADSETKHYPIGVPQLDSALWGTEEFEAKTDMEILECDFKLDIVTNPCGHRYTLPFNPDRKMEKDAYQKNFVMCYPEKGAPKAHYALEHLEENLKPKPHLAQLGVELTWNNYPYGGPKTDTWLVDIDKDAYFQKNMQENHEPETGDFYAYFSSPIGSVDLPGYSSDDKPFGWQWFSEVHGAEMEKFKGVKSADLVFPGP